MAKKKIGLVLSFVPGYSETFFINKISGLITNGYKVVLFVDYEPEKGTKEKYKIVVAPNFGKNLPLKIYYSILAILKVLFFNPRRSYKLFKLNKSSGFSFPENVSKLIQNQFIISYNLDWLHFGFGMLAVGREHLAAAMGAKMAVSFRGFDLYLSPLKHPNCYDLLFKTNVKYHVLSKGMVKTLKEHSIKEDKIEIITPAIDTNRFSSSDLHKSDTVLSLVTIARLHWKKGLIYTLEALSILKNKGVKFKYKIIGEGDELERLIFARHQLNLIDEVEFIGKIPHKSVKDYLQLANIYLQYSIQEGFCNAVLEAQSMGLLCIVSNAEGLDENILHDKTGWVVPKRRPDLLAEKIEAVGNLSWEHKKRIVENAVQRIQNEFSLEMQSQQFMEFYKN